MEHRTRITLLIPRPITHLDYIYLNVLLTELIDICDGVTISTGRHPGINPVFEGFWFNDVSKKVVADQQLLFFSDAPFSLNDDDRDDWLVWLNDLKWWCQTVFRQDIIWMTLSSVTRITYKDHEQNWLFNHPVNPPTNPFSI